jgi:uncharacterized membrane protein
MLLKLAAEGCFSAIAASFNMAFNMAFERDAPKAAGTSKQSVWY